MSVVADVVKGLKRIVLVEDRVARNSADLEKLGARIEDHERRLIQMETTISLAREAGRQQRLPD